MGVSILIDASRDGSLWWFPQKELCDPELLHQGTNLVNYLKSLGYGTIELPLKPVTITSDLLKQNNIVIRIKPSISNTYTEEEIESYKSYVKNGGKLILLGHFMMPGQKDVLAESFGIMFEGVARNERTMNRFLRHPLTKGMMGIPYSGSGITKYPEKATIVAWLSENTYVDLNDDQIENGEADPG